MTEERRRNYIIVGGMIFSAWLAFVGGREREMRRVGNIRSVADSSEKNGSVSPTSLQLTFDATNIADAAFADLYEQLRFSSRETRLAMRERIVAMPEGPAKEAARFTYNKLMVQIAPADSANAMLEIPNDGETLHTIVAAAPQSAMEALAPMVLKLPNTGDASLSRGLAFGDVMEKWSRVDPEAAAAFLENNYDESDFPAYAETVVQNWAAVDPAEAREWIGKLDPSRAYDLKAALLDGWFERDRAAAMDYAVAHAGDEDSWSANRYFADTIFCESPEEARAFINRLPPDQQQAVVEEIASVVRGDGNPAPRDLAKWLMQFPPKLWEKPISHAVIDWQDEDPAEFFSWAARLPAETQDKIAVAFADRYDPKPEDIEKYISIAATAPDPQLREKLIYQLVGRYGSMLKEKRQLLEQLPISPAEQHALQTLIPK
ncbi:MAG: hypothetical protein ABI925_06835 [Verrucomicrobiota bacterium]